MAQNDYQHAKVAATNLVASIASEIDRNIELYDLSLQAVVDGVRLPEINRISPELRQVVLFDRAATARDLGSIQVLDAAGDVRLDSRTLTPRKENFAGHGFFRVHQTQSDVALFGQKRGVFGTIKRELRRRSAIEPIIGHLKADGHLGRCYLVGRAGDAANVILSAVGYNFRRTLAWLRELLCLFLVQLWRALARPAPLNSAS